MHTPILRDSQLPQFLHATFALPDPPRRAISFRPYESGKSSAKAPRNNFHGEASAPGAPGESPGAIGRAPLGQRPIKPFLRGPKQLIPPWKAAARGHLAIYKVRGRFIARARGSPEKSGSGRFDLAAKNRGKEGRREGRRDATGASAGRDSRRESRGDVAIKGRGPARRARGHLRWGRFRREVGTLTGGFRRGRAF